MKVILHNSISLDGSFTGIAANMELHYKAVNSFGAQVYMVGSNTTSRASIEQNGETVPPETASDFRKPVRDPALPYWVIPDTKGTLQGILHYYRQFEYCRDVILLVSGIHYCRVYRLPGEKGRLPSKPAVYMQITVKLSGSLHGSTVLKPFLWIRAAAWGMCCSTKAS